MSRIAALAGSLVWLGLAACSIPNTAFHASPDNGDDDMSVRKLAFVKQPTTGVTQQPLGAIWVAIIDAQGNPVPSAGNDITLALGNNPGGANLLGSLTATAVAGLASFALVGVDKPATGYTLVASATGVTPATSTPFAATAPAFTLISTGIYGGHISSIAVSPAPASGTTTIFAGLANGVYKSVNNGATWTPASFGLDSGAGTLVADPKNPGVVYAVRTGPDGGAVGSPYFLKKTVSGGASWLDAGDMTTNTESYTVAVDAMNPSILYVGGSKLYRSTNGGVSWSVLSAFPFVSCSLITVDPVTSSLYCASYDSTAMARNGVYKSIDGGATWAAVNIGLASLVTSGPLVATPDAVFVSAGNTLYRSTNGGGNWTSLSIDFPYALAYAPSMPKRMYLSLGVAGVAVSNDAGASFGTAVSVGDVVQGLAVDPTNPNLVYAAGDNGVYVSTNGGVSWSFSSVGIAAHSIRSVAMAPSVPGTVVASADNGVYQTSNGGTSWAQATTTTGIVRFDPTTAPRVYLCGSTFLTSADGGSSFVVGSATGTGCTQFAFAGPVFFAAGFPGGTRKSSNSGTTWAATSLSAMFTYSVALGDGVGNVVVTGSNQGIYRSVDGGATFAQVSLDLAESLLADPMTPTRVIAGLECGSGAGGAMSNGGFRVSTDGGATFGNVIPGPCVQQLSSNGSTLYAVGRPFSALSTDHGATWTPIGASIPSGVQATSLAASADGKTVYLGTTAGLYKSTSGGL